MNYSNQTYKNYRFVLLLLLFTTVSAWCQSSEKSLKQHISYLADDRLEGRETGSEGEKLAAEYIVKAFEHIELTPKGEDGFLQSFNFNGGQVLGSNKLMIDGKELAVSKDFFPAIESASQKFEGKLVAVGYGIKAPELKHNDYKKPKKLKGKVVVAQLGAPESNNPHSDFQNYHSIQHKVSNAEEVGAKAIILIGSQKEIDNKIYQKKHIQNVTISKIPVIYLESELYSSLSSAKNVKGAIEQTRASKTGYNILGYIDNNAETTIVIGGHYDHLGYGHFGSLYTGKRLIHNGADDNSSGIALLIELAKQLKNTPSKQTNNYLFACFSGEELGLYGSNHFTKNPTISLETINYMLNFDMVGRLDVTDPILAINGTGTSPQWSVLDSLNIESIRFKKGESGVGPSDHTSFYLKDIPVLHFFSGAHEDYHKPSDDENKINYVGILLVQNIVTKLIDTLNSSTRLSFTKTKEESNTPPKFTVGLGVIPDYLFDGEGMRIDGIIDERVAAKAGFQAGDIVIQIGETIVKDLNMYMVGLSKYKKGDSTEVTVKRKEEIIKKEITF